MHVFDGVNIVVREQEIAPCRSGTHLSERKYYTQQRRSRITALRHSRLIEVIVFGKLAIGLKAITRKFISSCERNGALPVGHTEVEKSPIDAEVVTPLLKDRLPLRSDS